MLTVEIIYAFVIKCAPAGEEVPLPALPWPVARPSSGGRVWCGVECSAQTLVGFLAGSKKTNAIKAKELELNGVRRGLQEEEEEEGYDYG